MLVDWAVLPRLQMTPIAGKLWQTVVSLPGRKFASYGSRASQTSLERRAIKIPAQNAVLIVRPIGAAILRALKLTASLYPSPLCAEALDLPVGVTRCLPGELRPAIPVAAERTAYVHRGPDFWEAYCGGRHRNGAFPLRVTTRSGEADVVMQLLEVGRLRVGTLLALRLEPATLDAAATVGRALRAALRQLNVCVLMATEADKQMTRFLSSAGLGVMRLPCHWWVIPRPSDTFAAQDVRWWLTSADRDSHWGCVQPNLAGREAR
jgi:hypothetical protein